MGAGTSSLGHALLEKLDQMIREVSSSLGFYESMKFSLQASHKGSWNVSAVVTPD